MNEWPTFPVESAEERAAKLADRKQRSEQRDREEVALTTRQRAALAGKLLAVGMAGLDAVEVGLVASGRDQVWVEVDGRAVCALDGTEHFTEAEVDAAWKIVNAEADREERENE